MPKYWWLKLTRDTKETWIRDFKFSRRKRYLLKWLIKFKNVYWIVCQSFSRKSFMTTRPIWHRPISLKQFRSSLIWDEDHLWEKAKRLMQIMTQEMSFWNVLQNTRKYRLCAIGGQETGALRANDADSYTTGKLLKQRSHILTVHFRNKFKSRVKYTRVSCTFYLHVIHLKEYIF